MLTQRVPFRLKTVDDLMNEAARIGVTIPCSDDFSVFRKPITIGSVTMNNRFAINPMEGFDADNLQHGVRFVNLALRLFCGGLRCFGLRQPRAFPKDVPMRGSFDFTKKHFTIHRTRRTHTANR